MAILRYAQIIVVDTMASLPNSAGNGDFAYALDAGPDIYLQRLNVDA